MLLNSAIAAMTISMLIGINIGIILSNLKNKNINLKIFVTCIMIELILLFILLVVGILGVKV